MKRIYLFFITLFLFSFGASHIYLASGLSSEPKKPVLVFFQDASSTNTITQDTLHEGRYFINEHSDIVLIPVEINCLLPGFNSNLNKKQKIATSSSALLNDAYGIFDAIGSLEKIREDIALHNGDENNITICGEGIGATIATYLPIMKEAKGLFQKAIINSPILNLDQEENENASILPNIYEEYENGAAKDLKIIFTTNSDDTINLLNNYNNYILNNKIQEIKLNTKQNQKETTLENLFEIIKNNINDIYNEETKTKQLPEEITYNIEEFIKTASKETGNAQEEILLDLYDKIFFKLPVLKIAAEQSKWNDVYFLNYENLTPKVVSPFSYIINTPYLIEKEIATRSQLKFFDAHRLQQNKILLTYFTNFIKTGDPNKDNMQENSLVATASALGEKKESAWEKYTQSKGQMLNVSKNISIISSPFTESSAKNSEILLKYNISGPLSFKNLLNMLKTASN